MITSDNALSPAGFGDILCCQQFRSVVCAMSQNAGYVEAPKVLNRACLLDFGYPLRIDRRPRKD